MNEDAIEMLPVGIASISSWGTAARGEFVWARACRILSNGLVVLMTLTLAALMREGEGANPTSSWRAEVLVSCALLLIAALLPAMGRAYYYRRFGKSLLSVRREKITWF